LQSLGSKLNLKALVGMKKPKSIRVLCVDDHPIVLEGLSALVKSETDMVVVGEATDGQMAIEKCRLHHPDVVVMDLRMPVLSGAEAAQCIRKEFPATRIIVLTSFDGDEDIHRALAAGVQAYLLKAMARKELTQIIRDVHAGLRRIPSPVAERLGEHLPRVALSPRELEVLQLVAQGRTNKEIGAVLRIAEDTVKVHLGNTFRKLNVLDRTQAVVVAAKRGIIRLDGTL
jgi:DNA-binding NarL/FixJ family response regulator